MHHNKTRPQNTAQAIVAKVIRSVTGESISEDASRDQ